MDVIAYTMFGCVLIFIGVIGYLIFKDSIKEKMPKRGSKNDINSKKSDKNNDDDVNVLDSQDILDFEKIRPCNEEIALLEYKPNVYLGYIEVQGINFNLLSENERIMLEQSFGELINGLDFPAQIYVQSRKTNLDHYISKYRKSIDDMRKDIDREKRKSSDKKHLENRENQLAYGELLLNYFIQRTVHANLLERKYYFVVKYVHNPNNYEHELNDYEVLSAAYNDISNKAAVIIDSLSRSNLKSNLLSAFGIGEFLYNCYNRQDATELKFSTAVSSEYNHLFTTSKPVEVKQVELAIKESEREEKEKLEEIKNLVRG